jgi:hypothetical protein
VQQVLDTALAWSVIDHHFDVADFLLEHAADMAQGWALHGKNDSKMAEWLEQAERQQELKR